jgi:hypothetical protein
MPAGAATLRARARMPTAVVVLLVAVGLLAGCGGGKSTTTTAPSTTHYPTVTLGKAAYVVTMRRLGVRLGRAVQNLFPLVEARPGTDVSKASVAKIERTRAVVVDVQAHIAAISPPAPILAAHRQLANGVLAFRDELDTLVHVLQVGTSKPFGYYTQFGALRTIAKARDEIEKSGYKIG